MARYLLAVTAPILENNWDDLAAQVARDPSNNVAKEEIARLKNAARCIRALSELVILLSQRSHTTNTDATGDYATWGSLQFLEAAIHNLQQYKMAFRTQKMTPTRKKMYDAVLEAKRNELVRRRGIQPPLLWPSERARDKAIRETEDLCAVFAAPKIHMITHISEQITEMGSGDNFTTDISELLH